MHMIGGSTGEHYTAKCSPDLMLYLFPVTENAKISRGTMHQHFTHQRYKQRKLLRISSESFLHLLTHVRDARAMPRYSLSLSVSSSASFPSFL